VPSTSRLLFSWFEKSQKELLVALKELEAYNRTDFPPFSQVSSMVVLLERAASVSDEQALLGWMKEVIHHPSQHLMNLALSSDDWCDAPPVTVERARALWKAYCGLARAIGNLNRSIERHPRPERS
jgi:hypothetical protein